LTGQSSDPSKGFKRNRKEETGWLVFHQSQEIKPSHMNPFGALHSWMEGKHELIHAGRERWGRTIRPENSGLLCHDLIISRPLEKASEGRKAWKKGEGTSDEGYDSQSAEITYTKTVY